MHRRTFLQGLAAAAVGAPAITLLGQQDAQAAVAARTRSGAQFYKARIWTPAFQ